MHHPTDRIVHTRALDTPVVEYNIRYHYFIIIKDFFTGNICLSCNYECCSFLTRARFSSVVRAFAHDAMDRRIDPSWWTH